MRLTRYPQLITGTALLFSVGAFFDATAAAAGKADCVANALRLKVEVIEAPYGIRIGRTDAFIGLEGDSRFVTYVEKSGQSPRTARVVGIWKAKRSGRAHVEVRDLISGEVHELNDVEIATLRKSDETKQQFLSALPPVQRRIFELFEGNDHRSNRFPGQPIVRSQRMDTRIINNLFHASVAFKRLSQSWGNADAQGASYVSMKQIRQIQWTPALIASLKPHQLFLWVIDDEGRFFMAPSTQFTKHLGIGDGHNAFAAGEGKLVDGKLCLDIYSGTFMMQLSKSEAGRQVLDAMPPKVAEAVEILTGVRPRVDRSGCWRRPEGCVEAQGATVLSAPH